MPQVDYHQAMIQQFEIEALCRDQIRRNSLLAARMIVQAASDLIPPLLTGEEQKDQYSGDAIARHASALAWLECRIKGSAFSLENACEAIMLQLEVMGVPIELDAKVVGRKVIASAEKVALLQRHQAYSKKKAQNAVLSAVVGDWQ